MPETYRATFHAGRSAAVDIAVPDDREPLDCIAETIARELDLMRYEVQLNHDGGHIRLLGDDGPGVRFDLQLVDQHRLIFTPDQNDDWRCICGRWVNRYGADPDAAFAQHATGQPLYPNALKES